MRPIICATVVALASALTAHAATVTLSSSGTTTYAQDFNTLASTGTGSLAAALPGWHFVSYSGTTTYMADNGSNESGRVYSYGLSGDPDRALGSITNSILGQFSFGISLALAPDSQPLESLTIAYTGEQWRSSGFGAQTVSFYYSSTLPNPTGPTGTWVPALKYTSPIINSTAGPLNGNANGIDVTHTFSDLPLSPGGSLYFYWFDSNHIDLDHGLAIDDLLVTATFVNLDPPADPSDDPDDPNAVPLPSAAAGGLVLLTGCITRRRRR